MKSVPVTATNLTVYLNLAQAYEAEFSSLTRKTPDAEGRFPLDTAIGGEISSSMLCTTPALQADSSPSTTEEFLC